ncbi:flagellar hook assembly protein FlgD [Massilia sp. PAMC28688]|uniref:flagellar hook assembly protein FlgD n=1 Tax=Massilia sp. PAMC28688 TaxID=2861283 RepID=UPI001C6388F9|nr:flagellar hook assembly protein FlgD [Massilia sp. PAMC28688]QYF92011.1 flagellar hook assembly protein FlgD [Massilia sp. PAMC28688]
MSTIQNAPAFVSQDLLNSVNVKKNAPAAGSVEADQDKFMTLLVTQMKNQDPLNPLDNAQVTSQLAQLSTVTGVNKLNTTLESLKSSYQSSEALQAANLIGHGVLVPGDRVQLTDGKAIMGIDLATGADSVQVVVTDPRTGKEVQTINMGPQQAGTVPIAWDGVPDPSQVGADGKPVTLRNGNYLIKVVAERGGQALTDAKTLSFDSVGSVTTNAKDGVKLNLPNLGTVSLVDIKQIL